MNPQKSFYEFVRNWAAVPSPSGVVIRCPDDLEGLCSQIVEVRHKGSRLTVSGHPDTTTLSTIFLPVWAWLYDPSIRILVIQSRAPARRGSACRFLELAREFHLPVDGRDLYRLTNDSGGYRQAASPYQHSGVQVDIMILDEAFWDMSASDAKVCRELWLCRLSHGGSVLEIT